MSRIFKDRVGETSNAPGLNDFALGGALPGYQTFSGVAAVGDTCDYSAFAVDANGVPNGGWETGTGTFGNNDTLIRTSIQESSNGDAKVNFAGNTIVLLSVTSATLASFVPTAIGGNAGTAPHAYWRLYFPFGAGQDYAFAFAGLKMASYKGGPNLCAGGAAITTATGQNPGNLFDNDPSTYWNDNFGNPGSSNGLANITSWVGYHFANPVSVVEFTMQARSDAYDQTPQFAFLQYSDDGMAWTTLFGAAVMMAAGGQIATFDSPASSANGGSSFMGSTNLTLNANYNIANGAWAAPDTAHWNVDHDPLGGYAGNSDFTVPPGVHFARFHVYTAWQAGQGGDGRYVNFYGPNQSVLSDLRTPLNETMSTCTSPVVPVVPGDAYHVQYNCGSAGGCFLAGLQQNNFGAPCRVEIEWFSEFPMPAGSSGVTNGGDLVTGWRRTSDGFIEQWGVCVGTQDVAFSVPFQQGVCSIQGACDAFIDGVDGLSYSFSYKNATVNGFSARCRASNNNAQGFTPGEQFKWWARGK